MASRQEVLHAYRHLYKGLLHGVQYAIPARHIVRDRLRLAFREPSTTTTTATTGETTKTTTGTGETAASWDARAIKRTLWFLAAAGHEKGLEHKILKNLVRMHSERAAPTRHWRRASIWSKKPYVPALFEYAWE